MMPNLLVSVGTHTPQHCSVSSSVVFGFSQKECHAPCIWPGRLGSAAHTSRGTARADTRGVARKGMAVLDHDYFVAAGAAGCGLAECGADARRAISAFASSRRLRTD